MNFIISFKVSLQSRIESFKRDLLFIVHKLLHSVERVTDSTVAARFDTTVVIYSSAVVIGACKGVLSLVTGLKSLKYLLAHKGVSAFKSKFPSGICHINLHSAYG